MEELFSAGGWLLTTETSKPMPNGVAKTETRAQNVDSVSIIALNEDGTILLLREYRPFWECYVWMLPSGKIDKETDRDMAAMRELREETGFAARMLEPFFQCEFNERTKISNHVYIAQDLYEDPLNADPDELIEVHCVSLDAAIDAVLSGPRIHSTSALALLRYQRDRA